MPKNAQNKAAAYAYLDAMLEPSAQLAFGETIG
jgi:spermidine/putrescine-binding protein